MLNCRCKSIDLGCGNNDQSQPLFSHYYRASLSIDFHQFDQKKFYKKVNKTRNSLPLRTTAVINTLLIFIGLQ